METRTATQVIREALEAAEAHEALRCLVLVEEDLEAESQGEALQLAREFFDLADAERGFWTVETYAAYGKARSAVIAATDPATAEAYRS